MKIPLKKATIDLLLSTLRAIIPESDLERLLERVMQISLQILGADRALLFLYDKKSDALVFKYGVNVEEGMIDEAYQFSSSMIERAMQGEIVIVDDSGADSSDSITESIFKYDIKTILCAPIMAGGRLMGVIYSDTRGRIIHLDEETKNYFLCFADFVGDVITKVFSLQEKEEELSYLKRRLAEESLFPEIVGRSRSIETVKQKILRLASVDYPVSVLIIGESGSGKELIARAIHQAGSRASKPFVVVNCAAIPASLMESELFGHEKGAFTGAHFRKPGFFETADGGVIFLDEIGDLPAELQPKLLRVLQFGTFTRLGGRKEITVDVQVICATSKDLGQAMEEGTFRQSLFHRLAVEAIRVPPLRERRDDILLLANHFIRYFSEKMKKSVIGIDSDAQKLLMSYHYSRNNVREIKNICERAVLGAVQNMISVDDIIFSDELLDGREDIVRPSPLGGREYEDYLILQEQAVKELLDRFRGTKKATKSEKPFYLILGEMERKLILLALKLSDWKVKPAARLLGVNHLNLRSKLSAMIKDSLEESGNNLEKVSKKYGIPLSFLKSKVNRV